MSGFRRRPEGISVALDEVEVLLLQQIMGEMVEVVGGEVVGGAAAHDAEPMDDGQQWARDLGLVEGPGGTRPPADPVSARLFPDAYRDDAEASGEFRRFTERDLRAGKAAHAAAVLRSLPDGGGVALLDDELSQAWLGALNDARLALGTALGVEQDTEFDPDAIADGSDEGQRMLVYTWLNHVQSDLLDALMDEID